MNRKHFISSLLIAGAGVAATEANATSIMLGRRVKKTIVPPYLKPGDRIGITCPAGFISLEDIQPSLMLMRS
jgi:muramoyltetrapeptide carboxypeptidase